MSVNAHREVFSPDNLDDVDTQSPVTSKETQSTGSPDTGTNLGKNYMDKTNHPYAQNNLLPLGLQVNRRWKFSMVMMQLSGISFVWFQSLE